jgi:hypothetical protein
MFRIAKIVCLSFMVLKASCLFAAGSHGRVSIVTGKHPDKIEQIAAGDLSKYLEKIYPAYTFPVVAKARRGKRIVLSVDPKHKGLPESPEGYLITSDEKHAAIIAGSSKGLLSGVYGILDHLGVGFYMSEETMPAPKKEFSFAGWDFSDRPMVKERYIFNWHNFLSSCSGWDKKDWLEWVDHSRKMGYNAIMVHGYVYNPMHTYFFRGVEKPSGYITTSGIAHNWSAIPVNDVRRIPGGEIFDGPVIGCREIMGHEFEKEYPQMVRSMTRDIFAYAAERGMGINYAYDVDQSIVYAQKLFKEKLSGNELLKLGKRMVPNPDTAAGMEYYKAQVKGLVDSYPMLTQITCWFRGTSGFGTININELPDSWRKEYNACLKKNPILEKSYKEKNLLAYFVVGKLTTACQKALKEMDITGVKIGSGCWRHEWVLPIALFVPDIELFPLDWNVRNFHPFMKSQSFLDSLKTYADGRVIPYVWAQHDDGRYIGRCLKPNDRLYDKLKSAGSPGFGVIHWFKRPCDLYFSNEQRQVWERSLNEPYTNTCEKMAENFWGDKALSTYLVNWMKDAPTFGRATQPNMHYRPWHECRFTDKTRAKVEERIAYLNKVDTGRMTKAQIARLEYFKTLESFILQFIDAQRRLDQAEKYLAAGELDKAQDEFRQAKPEAAVATFAKLSSIGHKERGEMCYTVSLATKWLGDYDSFRQRARFSPIMIKLGEAVVDPAPGMCGRRDWQWYWLDKKGQFWAKVDLKLLSKKPLKVVTRKSTGKEDYIQDLYLEGLQLDDMHIPVSPIMRAGGVPHSTYVTKGRYRLKILASSPSEGTFTVTVNGRTETFTIKGDKVVECDVELAESGNLSVGCKLQSGSVILNGLQLEPVKDAKSGQPPSETKAGRKSTNERGANIDTGAVHRASEPSRGADHVIEFPELL